MKQRFLVFISFSAVIAGLFMLLRISHPAAWECFLFVIGMDKAERLEWMFMPEQFSFSDTNCIYEVVFEPQRALPHQITLRFDERIKTYISPGRIDGYYREDMMAGLVAKMTVKHCGTDEILSESICDDTKVGWVLDQTSGTNNVAQVECTLFSFSPHRLNRRFQDRLKIQVQLLRPPKCRKFGKGYAVHLVVVEGYPFK